MRNEDVFWDSSIDELKKGYKFDKNTNSYYCLMCSKEYTRGVIYGDDKNNYDAEYAVKEHIKKEHNSTFDYLFNLGKRYNGLSDIQKIVIKGMYENVPDKDIAVNLGNKAVSTVRNHKFSMREKYREAKIFIAIMDLINEQNVSETKFINFHKDIPIADDRLIITEEEKSRILKKYFDGEKLLKFPKKEKEKLIILQEIIKKIDPDRKYSELEINGVLKNIYSYDHIGIRRYLIDYKFMDRTPDCSSYWVKE